MSGAFTGATAKATRAHKGLDGAPDWTETRTELKIYVKACEGLPDRLKVEKVYQCSQLPVKLKRLIGTETISDKGRTRTAFTLGALIDALEADGANVYAEADRALTRAAKGITYTGPDAEQLRAALISAVSTPGQVDYITSFSSETGAKGPAAPKHTLFSLINPINPPSPSTPPSPTTHKVNKPHISETLNQDGPPAHPRPTATVKPSPEDKVPDGPPEPVQAILDGPTASTEATAGLTLADIKRAIADLDTFDLEEVTAYALDLHSNS